MSVANGTLAASGGHVCTCAPAKPKLRALPPAEEEEGQTEDEDDSSGERGGKSLEDGAEDDATAWAGEAARNAAEGRRRLGAQHRATRGAPWANAPRAGGGGLATAEKEQQHGPWRLLARLPTLKTVNFLAAAAARLLGWAPAAPPTTRYNARNTLAFKQARQ